MRTEEQKNNNFQELDRRVEQLLTPRFAPSADDIILPVVSHSTAKKSRSLWINIARIGGIAAALVIGIFIIISPNNTATAKVYDMSQLTPADTMPKFQNGDMSTFCYWMAHNIKYPQEAIDSGLEGKVIFSFIVETDGSLSEFKILQSPSVILSNEVERVFNNSPKWEPGLYMGEKVRVRLTVPVVLVIQKQNPNQ